MIERVVTNLLDNAMRHTPTVGRFVWRSGSRMNSLGRGGGQRPAYRVRCGRRLFQRPSALNKAVAGDRGGLGLMIVKRMLELHGGDIRLVDAQRGLFPLYVPFQESSYKKSRVGGFFRAKRITAGTTGR
jgi:K+-sensing histidine kinase KdpD